MKLKFVSLSILLLAICNAIPICAFAQQANPKGAFVFELTGASGDSFSNATFVLDWSIGEVLTESFSNEFNQLTQGFQQGLLEISTIVDNTKLELHICAFPNPTTSVVNININGNCLGLVDLVVTDLTGRKLLNETITQNSHQIDLSAYSPGLYMVLVKYNSQLLKSFKIIKR
jgi:hypothetical protein